MSVGWFVRVREERAGLMCKGVTLDAAPLLLLFLLSFDGSETHVETVQIRKRGQESRLRVRLLLPEVEIQDLLDDVLLLLLLRATLLLQGKLLGNLLVENVGHI